MSKEEKKQNLFPDSKGDMPDSGSLKSLSTLVVPGPGKSFLFSGIELDEENDYSLDILGGPPSPLGTEISLTVPHIPLVSKTSTAKGVTFRQVVKVHEKTLSATSTENTRDENQLLQVMEPCLPANASDHKSSFPDTNRFAGGTSTDAETEKLGLGKKIGNQNQITACESGQEMVSEKCKTVVNKVKDRSLLLSVDSDSCLDWTDDDLSAEKVAESTAFASHDEFSDIGEDKSYLVVDSIGDCDHEYDESKQESDKCQTRKITSRDNPVEKNLDKESLQSKSVQNEMKNTLNDDEWEKNDGYKNVQPDETEFLALKLSPTQLNKDKINNLTPISALDKTETDTGVRTELMNSEIPTTENRDDESILTTKTDTHINLEETINNTELSPLVDKGDNVSEADLSVDVGDANDSTDISKSLDLSKSPLLVIDESVSGNKMSPSFEENEVRSKPDPCIRMLEHGNDVNLKSVGNSAERMTDMSMASNVTEDLEVLQKTENDAKTQATSEIHGKTICQSDEMSNSSAVQLELAELDKKDCEKQYKMDVHSTHTTEFSSVMAEREAGSIIFVDDIDTVEEEITNDSPTTEGDDRQKRDSSLVYLDDTVSSCDEDPSNTVATYNNIERKEEGPSIVYLDDTVTSADEAVTELTDDTDVIFVKKTNIEETKIEESGDDVIYIPEATEEVEIVNLQDTTDPNKFFSCQGKEEKQDMQMYSSEVEPVDLSCHGHEKQIVGKDEIYIVADEGVNTDETVSAYHDEDESNDRTDVVGVVNSGLDSEEKIEDQNIERSIASAEPPNMDKTFAVTSFSGKPYLTDKSNNEPYQTDASQSLASDVSTIAHSCSLPGLPVDTVTTTHRPAVYSEQFVPTVNIAVTRSQGNMTTTFAVPTCTARYPTRSVAAVAPLSSVSTPSHGKVEPDNNCEWISPPSQPAYPHVVSPSSEAVNLSHSIPSLGQSPFGSYMVPVTSTGQENSPDPMPGPYFVSPYLSPSPLNPGVQLLGSSPFSSRTVMPPFSSAIQTAEWPHTSPASNYYSPRGLVSLGSTIYDSASWQNYQAVYRGSNPQLYPSANIQQIQQPPGSAAQLQPWMFSVRLPPEFRPTNPNTFFSVIQPRFYTFPNLLYRSLSNLNHTNNFDPFGKTFTIPTLRELCTKNIENDDVLKSAAAQSFSRQLTEGQKPLTDDLDITNKVIPESVGSQRENMTVDCFNPYRERVDLQGNEKGLQFSDATSCKGLAENNHLLGTPLTICPKSTLEIPENTYSEDEKHLLASETASGSHQNITHDKSKLFMIANNITDTLGTPKKFNAQNTTEANQYERQCNLDNYDSTERSVDAMKLYEKMNGADVNQEGQKTMSRKECKEKRIIGEMEEFYSSIDSLLNEVDTKDSGQALERKRRQIEDAGKSSATEFLEQKQFSDSIKNACDTEESFSKLPFMEGYQGEKFRIKETELTENTNTDEKTMTKRGKEIEGFDGEINGFNKNDDPLLLRSDIKDCLKALEVKRKEIEDAAKSNAVEVFGINKDETCDMKTVPVSDSYVWNGKIIPLNKQIGPERADLGGQLELGENSYLNDKHGNKCSVMPVDRVSKMDNFSGSTGEKSCMRETQQQNELEMIGLKKTSAALDKTSFSETMLVTDCVSPVKCLEEATEREESISKLPYKENFKAADRCRKNHTNMEVTKTVSKEDKTMTSRDKEHEIFEDEKDNFLKSDDPLLLREDIKDCLKALEIKRKEIKDASKSNAVEVLGTNNDVTCDMKTVWNDKIMPVGSKGADNGGLLKLVESSFFNGNHENVNPVLPVDGSFEMGSHSESIVENSSLIEINHQNDIEMRESDMSNNFEASLDKMLKAETSHITDCVTPTVSANESSAIEGSVSKLTFMVSFEEGTSEIEYADKGVTEKASKEERTNTDRDVEHENLCDEIGDSNKTDDPLLPRGDIKDCIDAIEAKRRELRDAASVNSYKEGKSEIKCSAKEVSEKASKEDKTKTVSGQEQENLSGEIGDSYKSFDPLIKDCLQALEIKRKELKDAAKSNAVETLGLNKVETCELKTVPLTDSCYIWNGEMIPLNKTIGPEREDNGNRFELVENCHSNDRQDNVSSDIPVDSCLEKGNYSASTVESSGLREMQQQNGIGLMATDSLMESYKKETSEIKHTDMEYTENTSKEDESKISKAEEQAILEEEVDGVNKTVNPLLLNTDIKDCLKALEIKRKEIEDAAQSNAIEVLELESMTENISLKQSDQMIPQLTQSRSGCEKREKIVDKDSRNDTNELEHNQMDQSKDLGLKSVKFEKVAEKRLVDYEEEDENSLHSSDAKSKLNIVAYEDNDTDDENDNEGVETEIDRTICAETLPPSTNIKQPDAEEKELRKYTTDEKQAQEKMVENETDNCNISVVSEKVSCQLSTTAGNMQEEKDSDSQFSLLKISQGQLKPASDIQHIRVAELDKGMESIFEDIVTGFSEVVKYSDTNDKLSQLSDVESDDELYQEILSPVFTDEETEFSDSSSLTMKPAKQEAKSKSVLQNNLSISLLSSAYDDETDDESNEATDLSKAGKSDFKDPLAALKGYTNENSDSSDSESASSSGESSSNSSDDESELTDNQYEAAKGSNTLLNAEYEMSSSDELRDELLEKGLSANSSQTNVVKAAETKDKFGDEMDKYMKCKWVEEGILSPDNSDTESVCNTSCGSPDTLKAISDTEELYQSDAIIHQTPKPQSSEGDVLDSSANDGKPSLLSTKRAWLNRTKGRQSILTESDTERTKSDTEKTNTLEASFAESSVSNVSNLSLAKLEQRQKRLINKILMQSDSDSSVTTGSGSGSESSAAKVKAAVTKKLADIRFWIQKGEDANQRDINEAIQKKTEVTKNLSRKETKLLRRKMLMEKLEQARLDCPSSDNDDRQYAKLETSRGYSVITIDSTSGSNKETKSSGELSDSKSAGELSFIKSAGELSYSKSAGELSYSKSAGEVSYSKSAGELSDSTLSVKSASTVRSLGQRPEADLRAVVITIKNDRAEATSTSKSDYQRTSSPISPPTRKRTQSGRQNDSLEYVSDNFDTKFNKDIELPSQYSNKIYHQDSYKTRTETEKLPYNRHAGSAPGMYSDQENRTTVVRSEQPKAFRERHRSSSGSISSLASDSEANKQKTWNRNEHKTSNIRESPRRSRRDGPYLYGSRASSREPLRSDSRGYRKRSSSLTRCRKESRSLSRGSSLSSSRSHSKGKLNSVSPSRRFRASKSRSPSMRSRSRSGSLRQRTGSRSGNARGRSRSPAFQRRSRSPATKRQDSQASSSNVRHYTSRNRSTSGMFRNRSRSPGLRSRSGSRDSRQSRYSGHERCRRSTSRESGALSTSSSDRGFDERFTARRDNENRERERFYSERFSSRNEIGNRSRERDVIPTSVYQDSEDARKKNLDYISRWNNSDRQWSGGYDSNTSSKQPTFAMRAEARSLIDEMKDRDGREVSGKRKDLARYEVKTLIDKNKKREMRDSSEKISTKSVGGGARFDLRKKLGHKESTLDHKDLFRSDHKPNRTGDLSTRSGHFTNRRTSQDRVHRDIQLVVKREKIVILHSSVLAYEKQGKLFVSFFNLMLTRFKL